MDEKGFKNLLRKMTNVKWSIVFNRACLKENIYIYIHTKTKLITSP